VGGVSERAGAKAGGSNPFARNSFACRGGERHPGLLEGGTLRGVTSERRPRSVRRRQRVSPRRRRRADDSGCPKVAEEGNAVGMRHKAYALDAGTRDRCMRSEDASFARSFDLCTSILTMHRGAQAFSVVGRSREHHGWASSGNREQPSLGLSRTDGAQLAACHSRRKSRTWHVEEKEGDRGLRPCEDQELGFGCPHVVVQLQKSVGDVWPRISSAYTLQKERSVE